MSTVKISDLPPIAHHMQIIILAEMIGMWHYTAVRQELPANSARELAIQYVVKPSNDRERHMVTNAYKVAIRLFTAMDDLGLKWDKRPITLDNLVTLGL